MQQKNLLEKSLHLIGIKPKAKNILVSYIFTSGNSYYFPNPKNMEDLSQNFNLTDQDSLYSKEGWLAIGKDASEWYLTSKETQKGINTVIFTISNRTLTVSEDMTVFQIRNHFCPNFMTTGMTYPFYLLKKKYTIVNQQLIIEA